MSTAVGSPTDGNDFSTKGTFLQSNGAIGTRHFLWFFEFFESKREKCEFSANFCSKNLYLNANRAKIQYLWCPRGKLRILCQFHSSSISASTSSRVMEAKCALVVSRVKTARRRESENSC